MRPAPIFAALALIVAAPAAASAQSHTCTAAPARLCHTASAKSRHWHLVRAPAHRHLARYGRAFHIPRFSQGEAEAEVHTVYPYRTGLYVPWPDAYAAPYPYGAPYPY